jgi:tRNA(fMet)-specific endonuclease VapC
MKNQPAAVAHKFASLRVGDVFMSSITLAELEHGVLIQPDLSESRRLQLDILLGLIPSRAFDNLAAQSYGKLRADGSHLGRNRFDTLIAAHALSLKMTLVSNNISDFKGIAGLRLENWVS